MTDSICGRLRRLLPGRFRSRYALVAIAATLLPAALAGCGDSATKAADLTTPTGGRLELGETEYDFGKVPVGETVTHSFAIKNSGDGDLRLGEPDVKLLEGC